MWTFDNFYLNKCFLIIFTLNLFKMVLIYK